MEKPIKKIDRRIKKTKKLLRDGLTALMKNKSFKDITVKELADTVDINRGTFYLYYKDVNDMLDKIESEMMDDFNDLLYSHPVESLIGEPLPLLEEIFLFLADNADICKVLLSKNGDIRFIKRFTQVVHEKCLNDWLHFDVNINQTKFEYSYSYFLYGCIGMVETWLNDGMQMPPKEMAVLMKELILTGISLPMKTTNSTI